MFPKPVVAMLVVAAATAIPVRKAGAAVFITEVHPSGSGSLTYAADFFELTNTGPASVDVTGWKFDDNSNSFSMAVALRGVANIPAGKSVVFFEGTADGSTDATIQASFLSAWFGANVPAGFTMGAYGGSGVGLSTAGDAVNIFDANGTLVTGVAFGAATLGVTFDNAARVSGTTLPLPMISTLSTAGANGAFLSPSGETGSPGTVGATIPAPSIHKEVAIGQRPPTPAPSGDEPICRRRRRSSAPSPTSAHRGAAGADTTFAPAVAPCYNARLCPIPLPLTTRRRTIRPRCPAKVPPRRTPACGS